MKKIIIPLICICLVLVGAFIINARKVPVELADQSDQLVEINLKAKDGGADMSSVEIEAIITTADLVKIYTDYQSLVADAEIVVVGTVKDVTPFCNEQSMICSTINLDIETVLKGEVKNDMLSYYVYGGKISKIEYYQANAEKTQ